MNIGIDLDEVVTDYLDALNSFLLNEHNIKKLRSDYKTANWLDQIDPSPKKRKQIIQLWLASPKFDAIKLSNNAKQVIEALAKNNNNVIYFFTSRHQSQDDATSWWLEKHLNIPFDIVYTSNQYAKKDDQIKETKMELCEQNKIQMFITHQYSFALECAQKKMPVILFDKPWSKGEQLERINRVSGWAQVVEIQKDIAKKFSSKMAFNIAREKQKLTHRKE